MRADPPIGELATSQWHSCAGDIGVLVSANMSNTRSLRPATSLTDERNSAATPLLTPGYFIPNVLQNVTYLAKLKRREVNGSLQWQVTPSLQAYVDSFYTQFKTKDVDYG